MSYGYETFDAQGNSIFSTEDQTWTLLATRTAPANTAATWTGIPIMPTRIVTRQMLDQVTGSDEAYVHTYTLNGGTLTTTPPDYDNTSRTFFMVFGR